MYVLHTGVPLHQALFLGGRSAGGGAQHHFGDEADDGARRLLGVQLGKQVARVAPRPPRLLGHEPEDPGGGRGGYTALRGHEVRAVLSAPPPLLTWRWCRPRSPTCVCVERRQTAPPPARSGCPPPAPPPSSPAVLGVRAAERDVGHGVMAAEEEPGGRRGGGMVIGVEVRPRAGRHRDGDGGGGRGGAPTCAGGRSG